jgi:hypothetical protein
MSTIKANNILEATSGGATYFLAKSYSTVHQAGTQALRDSGNISSITDNGTGNTTFNMSNAQPNGYYSISTYTAILGGGGNQHQTGVSRNNIPTTSNYRLISLSNTWQSVDGWVGASIFS